jgi:hypothetical protein
MRVYAYKWEGNFSGGMIRDQEDFQTCRDRSRLLGGCGALLCPVV